MTTNKRGSNISKRNSEGYSSGSGSKRVSRNNTSGRSSTRAILSNNYECIGSYEDKPNNRIYFLVRDTFEKGRYDCILEYDLFLDRVSTVYKDGRQSSDGNENSVLNFNENHLVTGINKVGDILYWTDGNERPRKINVELAKENEINIWNANNNLRGLSRYQDIYFSSQSSSVFIGVSPNHGFEVGDELYTQLDPIIYPNPATPGFNGYTNVIGLIPSVNSGVTFSVTNGSYEITASASDFGSFSPGDFIGIEDTSNFPHYHEIESISGNTITLVSEYVHATNAAANPLQFNSNNVGGIITDCPWSGSFSATGGLLLYANPEGAYSPLISFGSTEIKEQYIDAVKHQPLHRPTVEGVIDGSALTNNIMDGMFQFKYRYKHRDEELTSYSAISDIVLDNAFAANSPLNAKNYSRIFNQLNVSYDDSISDVKEIEVVARKGNLGEFILIDTIPNNFTKYLKKHKNSLITGQYEFLEYPEIETESLISFKNNGVYPFIDKADSQKLYDAVPKKAQAQTILSNNRLAYGNIVEGYDNTPLVVSSSFRRDGMPQLTTGTQNVELRYTSMTSGSAGNGMLGDNGPNTGEYPLGDNNAGAQHSPEWELSGLELNPDINQMFVMSYHFNIHHNPGLIGATLNRGGSMNFSLDITGMSSSDQIGIALASYINSGNGQGYVTTMGSGANDIEEVSATYSTSTKRLRVLFQFADNANPVAYWTFNLNSSSQTVENNAYLASGDVGVSTFKKGAFHDFGISYFDETNRCSFVNVAPNYGQLFDVNPTSNSEQAFGVVANGTRVYNRFWSEDSYDLGQTNRVRFQLYHKPPVWATHYQFCYAGNTSVDEFIQMSIANARKADDADNTQVYLSLQSLKGEDVSYNENSPSKLDYDFAKGDRIRFISCEHNGSRKKFTTYIDLEIAGEDLFTTTADAPFSASSVSDSGWYVRIVDPELTTAELEDGSTVSVAQASLSSLSTSGFNKLVAEIYRPKKSLDSDQAVYYEIGPKRAIISAGQASRAHSGDSNQNNNFFISKDTGIEISATPAIIDLFGGDIYMKPRTMQSSPDGSAAPTTFFPEDYYLNDFHPTNSWNRGRINVVNNNSAERRLEASVYYSETYSSTGAVNGLSSFNLANSPYFDYNKDFGSIQSLKMRDNDLIIFHEDKVGRVLVEKDILTTATGEGSVSLSTNILSNYVSLYAGENGCSLNPESIVKFGSKFFFTDIKRGVVLRLSADGLTIISDQGMRDYFRDFGELYVNSYGDLKDYIRVLGGYDPKYDEYVLTLPKIELKRQAGSGDWGDEDTAWDDAFGWDTIDSTTLFEAKTLAFNERIGRWTSFYSFMPEFYGKVARQFVSFKGGRIYKHNVSDKYAEEGEYFNRFYSSAHPSKIEFPFNVEPSSVKTYNALSLEGDVKLEAEMLTNTGRYHSNYDRNNITTNINYKKVGGSINNNGTIDSLMIEGVGTKFYEELKVGDPIRIYGTKKVQNGDSLVDEHTYIDRIVRTINSDTLLSVNTSIGLTVSKDRLEVLDYKTKENIHYSNIPFVTSEAAVDNAEDHEFTHSGDGSDFFGLGMGALTINEIPALGANIGTISGISLPELPGTIKVNLMEAGGRYIISNDDNGSFNYNSVSSLASNTAMQVFTCLRETDEDQAEVYNTENAVYVSDGSGTSTFVGYALVTSGGNLQVASNLNKDIEGFFFIAKTGTIEGEKMKGNYMMTTLTANDHQSKYKFNLYAANADIDKSELSNR